MRRFHNCFNPPCAGRNANFYESESDAASRRTPQSSTQASSSLPPLPPTPPQKPKFDADHASDDDDYEDTESDMNANIEILKNRPLPTPPMNHKDTHYANTVGATSYDQPKKPKNMTLPLMAPGNSRPSEMPPKWTPPGTPPTIPKTPLSRYNSLPFKLIPLDRVPSHDSNASSTKAKMPTSPTAASMPWKSPTTTPTTQFG